MREPLRSAFIAFGEAPGRRPVDEGFEKPPARADAAQPAPAHAAQAREPVRERADAGGKERLQALAQAPRQHRRGAGARDGDHDRIAIDDGGNDDARSAAIIDDVHGNRARLAQARDPAIQRAVRGRHDDQTRAVQILGNELPERDA